MSSDTHVEKQQNQIKKAVEAQSKADKEKNTKVRQSLFHCQRLPFADFVPSLSPSIPFDLARPCYSWYESHLQLLKEALREISQEVPPASPEQQEAYFQEQVAQGEQLATLGTSLP